MGRSADEGEATAKISGTGSVPVLKHTAGAGAGKIAFPYFRSCTSEKE